MSKPKKLFNRITLTDVEAFKHYRENAEYRKLENTPRRESYSKLINLFYKKVSEKMTENENGVFLKGFGYFTILMNPKRTTVKIKRHWTNKELYLNPHTRGRVFHPIFLPISDNFLFKLFIMDKSFNRDLKTRLKEKLQSDTKYLNHYGLYNSMFKNKR